MYNIICLEFSCVQPQSIERYFAWKQYFFFLLLWIFTKASWLLTGGFFLILLVLLRCAPFRKTFLYEFIYIYFSFAFCVFGILTSISSPVQSIWKALWVFRINFYLPSFFSSSSIPLYSNKNARIKNNVFAPFFSSYKVDFLKAHKIANEHIERCLNEWIFYQKLKDIYTHTYTYA